MTVGFVLGLGFAPADYQQGESFRIIYLHLPAVFVAQSAYLGMAIAGAIALIWRMKVAEMVLKSIAPIGASLTAIALLSGAIWGKPTWGTYWVWDARLISTLVLLFLFLGVIALGESIKEASVSARASAVLAIVGVVNIPIIKYSVEWWNSLHQGATFKVTAAPSMPAEMYIPLLFTVFGTYFFFGALVLMRTRTEVLRREHKSRWVRALIQQS